MSPGLKAVLNIVVVIDVDVVVVVVDVFIVVSFAGWGRARSLTLDPEIFVLG